MGVFMNFKSKRQERDFKFIEKNLYFQKEDIKTINNNIIIDLHKLSNDDLDVLEILIGKNNNIILNKYRSMLLIK